MSQVVAFTGSQDPSRRSLDEVVSPVLEDLIQQHQGGEIVEFVTGGCVGIDAYVARYLRREGCPVHTILPANHAKLDRYWRYATSHHQMPPGTTYRDRNVAMIERCTRLVAFPRYAEGDWRSRRSGSWQTIRLGRKAGKLAERDIHVLEP